MTIKMYENDDYNIIQYCTVNLVKNMNLRKPVLLHLCLEKTMISLRVYQGSLVSSSNCTEKALIKLGSGSKSLLGHIPRLILSCSCSEYV